MLAHRRRGLEPLKRGVDHWLECTEVDPPQTDLAIEGPCCPQDVPIRLAGGANYKLSRLSGSDQSLLGGHHLLCPAHALHDSIVEVLSGTQPGQMMCRRCLHIDG